MATKVARERTALAGPGSHEPDGNQRAQPLLGQHGPEIQAFGTVTRMPIGLGVETCRASAEALNRILADTLALRDLYKKQHWQVSGPTFYQLHKLFDKHFEEQVELADAPAERVQKLGGVSIAMAHDVVEMTRIPRPPRGREEAPAQIARLLEAHEIILKAVRPAADQAAERGDQGTNDLLVSNVIRTHEKQVWFLAEHLVDTPLARADEP
jgi:starvation-inducible DNA-binding protein